MYAITDSSSDDCEEPPECPAYFFAPGYKTVGEFTYLYHLKKWVLTNELCAFRTVVQTAALQQGFPLEYDRVMEVYKHLSISHIVAVVFDFEQAKYSMEYSISWNYRDTYMICTPRQLIKREMDTTLRKINQWEKDYFLTSGIHHMDPFWDFYEPIPVVRKKYMELMECFYISNHIRKMKWLSHGFIIVSFEDLEVWFVFYLTLDIFGFYPIW